MMNNPVEKIYNVYKPVGITSYDVVRRIKKVLNFKKVGHGGTLDPFAEGVLLILVGKATKKMSELLMLKKSYEAVLKLGEQTDTADNTGTVTEIKNIPEITQGMIDSLIERFSGTILQTPPAYSAKKINGKRAYKLARQGKEVKLEPREITIYDLSIEVLGTNSLKIHTTCSSGTYVRTLGEDIARSLNTAGHLVSLKRTSIGDYHSDDALLFDNLNHDLHQDAVMISQMQPDGTAAVNKA